MTLNQIADKAQAIANNINMPLVSCYENGRGRIVLTVDSGSLTETEICDRVIERCDCFVSKKWLPANLCELSFNRDDF